MKPIVPYLALPGTCEEAMRFYADILDGEITIMTTFAESPIEVPPEAEQLIFNAEVRAGDLVIKASDNPTGEGIGSMISLFVTFPHADERQQLFDTLAADGEVVFEPDGPFAMVRDQFGVQWMLVLEE